MTFVDLLQMSSTSLLKHKLRSGLTLLGIVIGILSVGAITSVVRGIDRYMADLLGSIGSQGFVVTRMGMPASEEDYLKALKRRTIPPSVAETIKRECPSVTHAAPFVRSVADVKSGRLSAEDVYVDGTTEDAQYMTDIGLEDGRYFTPYEIQHARQVCIVGSDVAEKIFSVPDPVGKTLYIKGHRFTVIGSHGKMGTVLGISRDAFVRMPFTTFERIFGRGFPADISVRSRSPEEVSQAIQEVRSVMRRVRKLQLKDEDDFGILTSEALMRMWRSLSATIFMVSIGVGGISLLVGGIGIMNIMFVSVKERTTEIGLRKATGATRRHIVLQFLTESALLCFIGGGIGVGIGVGAAKILSWRTSIPVAAEWWAIGLSLGVAVGVGLFFGVYPAVRAASLQPVDALRYEQ
jgi:putative ABC transport system permease protein